MRSCKVEEIFSSVNHLVAAELGRAATSRDLSFPLFHDDVSAVLAYIHKIQKKLTEHYQVDDKACRMMNIDSVHRFISEVIEHGALIFMRDGQLFDADPEASSRSVAQNKIMQMRKEKNLSAPITKASAIEFVGTMILMKYLQVRFNVHFDAIQTSMNVRAASSAQALAKFLSIPVPGRSAHEPIKVLKERYLTCVNYQDKLRYEQLQTVLTQGELPWKQEVVDQICGEGTFEAIAKLLREQVAQYEPARLRVSLRFTHAQQIDCLRLRYLQTASAQARDLQSAKKMGCFGMVGFWGDKVFVRENGLYLPVGKKPRQDAGRLMGVSENNASFLADVEKTRRQRAPESGRHQMRDAESMDGMPSSCPGTQVHYVAPSRR